MSNTDQRITQALTEAIGNTTATPASIAEATGIRGLPKLLACGAPLSIDALHTICQYIGTKASAIVSTTE